MMDTNISGFGSLRDFVPVDEAWAKVKFDMHLTFFDGENNLTMNNSFGGFKGFSHISMISRGYCSF